MFVVNLFGGPGTGKSTTAALVFGDLKTRGVNAELVTEFAKELVWEGRKTIECQPYIFGKQLWRLDRLREGVDVVVTDSPILLSAFYGKVMGEAWREVVLLAHWSFSSLNIFLDRDDVAHPYSPAGRYQSTVEEASEIDVLVHDLLHESGISHHHVSMGGGSEAPWAVVSSMAEDML